MKISILDSYRIFILKSNYKNKFSKLKAIYGKRPIRVIFLVTEVQKWGYQSLYEELEKDSHFEPLILVFPMVSVHRGKELYHDDLQKTYNFFKSRNMKVEYCYQLDAHKYLQLEFFKPDIVFYEQPYVLPKKYKQQHVSKFALTCYIHYGIAGNIQNMSKNKKFFDSFWKFFVSDDIALKEYSNVFKNTQFVVSGHPKLDTYKYYDIEQNSRRYVIYAPHFSIGNAFLKFSTFDWSGKFLLEFAKAHPQFQWVFKPHPNLKSHFINSNYMTEAQIDEYFKQWEKIGYICDSGNYFDLFKNSRMLITDCGSFLVEYAPTLQPVLHLINDKSVEHGQIRKVISSNYYKIYSQSSLKSYLEEVLIHDNDFMKEERISQFKKVFPPGFNSAKNIVDYLKRNLEVL